MRNIYDYTLEELEDYFVSCGDKKFRAIQIYDFLYKKRIDEVSGMNNIGSHCQKILQENFSFEKIKILLKQEDEGDSKYLFELLAGERIESVLMFHDYGISICVSSQVGCNMGCRFCESGRLRKVRNLEAYEIVQQILLIEADIGKRITHVVVMGIGEPMDNYDNVMRFIHIINNGNGIGIGSRHITVSTCGVIPGIEKFIHEDGQVNLAISLHAPNDEIRKKIMPIASAYSMDDLFEVIKKYIKKTNRRVTIEYIMLEKINDMDCCARELAKKLKGILCYVNLIPYNETENIGYKRSSKAQIMRFYDILKKENINVTVRREFGGKVDAACGQLRANNTLSKGEV